MIPNSVIEDILHRADIVDIISNYIPVTKKGSTYVAICPFHADKNPSLQISRNKQIYKCFACGAGGNAFTFVSEFEHIPFLDAVKKVAALIGYQDDSLKEQLSTRNPHEEKYYRALKDVADFYHYICKTEGGTKAIEYFAKRDITPEMQDYFLLGYAPEDSDLLLKTMRGKGYDLITLDHIGITTRKNGVIIDRFHGRVLFPIHDEQSSIIGFSGRILEGDEAKYINSIGSSIFVKSNTLYNYQNAKNEAKQAGYVYVTEGFMDVFALYRVHIRSAVALMGTAFTPGHAKMLRKLNVEVRIMLDGDHAGRVGVLKMIPILEKEQVNFRIVDYQDKVEDPDELRIRYGEETLKQIANQLIDAEKYLIDYYKKNVNLDELKGKKEFLTMLAPRVNTLKTSLERETFLNQLAETCKVSLQSVLEFVPSVEKERISPSFPSIKKPTQNLSQFERHERQLIFSILKENSYIEEMIKEDDFHFEKDIYGTLFEYILELYKEKKHVDANDLMFQFQSSDEERAKELLKEISSILMEEETYYDKEIVNELIDSVKNHLKTKKKRENKRQEMREKKDQLLEERK